MWIVHTPSANTGPAPQRPQAGQDEPSRRAKDFRHIVGHAGAFFFPVHAERGCDDFGILTMTDAQGRVATLCGGRIGVASHPQGGPARAYLIGSRHSATVDGKKPALDTYLRDYLAGYDYRP